MVISRRSIARSTALTLAAATFAACSDSSTGPLDLSPDQFESIGASVAAEIETGVAQLTAQNVLGDATDPTLSTQRSQAVRNLSRGGFAFKSAAVSAAECGVPSQNPPVDTDADNVPDNFSVTFALPACHIVDPSGTLDLTGVVHVSDPTPGTAGFALNFSLDNLRLAFSGTEGNIVVTRDGLMSVVASQSGLSQTHDWDESAQISGQPGVSVGINWTATFAAAQGSVITAGQPLPNGVYQPNGTVHYQQGDKASSFSIETLSPLQYDASCAADVESGLAMTPFTAGSVRLGFSDAGRSGHVVITYGDCNEANVVFAAN